MSEATKACSDDQVTLCIQLRSYMEETSHEEHAALEAIVKRVEEIKGKIMAAATEGKIDPRGVFPEEKLVEVQGYIQELQSELQKILNIHEAVAQRWAAQKIDEGVQEGLASAAVKVVLGEYRKRWESLP